MSTCDKCARYVPEQNDAVLVEAHAKNNRRLHLIIPLRSRRHFLPVVADGQVICEGSPSRSQYIEGQPRDPRGDTYRQELADAYRSAYRRVLEEFSS